MGAPTTRGKRRFSARGRRTPGDGCRRGCRSDRGGLCRPGTWIGPVRRARRSRPPSALGDARIHDVRRGGHVRRRWSSGGAHLGRRRLVRPRLRDLLDGEPEGVRGSAQTRPGVPGPVVCGTGPELARPAARRARAGRGPRRRSDLTPGRRRSSPTRRGRGPCGGRPRRRTRRGPAATPGPPRRRRRGPTHRAIASRRPLSASATMRR